MGVTQPYVRPLTRVMTNEFLNSLGWDFRMVAVRTIRLGVLLPARRPSCLDLIRPEFHRHSVAALRVAPFKLYR